MYLLLFVVHNCRNEAIDITKKIFYIHFLICNPTLGTNQAIKVNKNKNKNKFISENMTMIIK